MYRESKVERETNKMQLILCLLSVVYLNMFRESLCPSSGEKYCVLPHMVFSTGCVGRGRVELGRKLCALRENCEPNNNIHTVHTVFAFQLHTTTASTANVEHHMR